VIVDFIYEHIEQARRSAMREMLLAAALDGEAFRSRLLLYLERSESMARLRRQAESEQDWRQAFQLDAWRSWRSQLERAEKLARAGQHAWATDKVVRLAKEKQSSSNAGPRYFTMAGIYALSVSAVRRDEMLAEGDRTKLADRYAGQAMRRLGQARKAGFFKDPTKVEQLRTDPKFESLSTIDAFQKLLIELGVNES
jgi:hypothetical protein